MRHRIGLGKCALVALALSCGLAGGTAEASSAARTLTLGEVTANAERGVSAKRFKQLVVEELERFDERALPKSVPHVVSASLVRLEARRGKDGARPVVARCEVSATLRRQAGGTLVAMLRGSGRATLDPEELDETREDVVRAAVRSALGRIPEALGR